MHGAGPDHLGVPRNIRMKHMTHFEASHMYRAYNSEVSHIDLNGSHAGLSIYICLSRGLYACMERAPITWEYRGTYVRSK